MSAGTTGVKRTLAVLVADQMEAILERLAREVRAEGTAPADFEPTPLMALPREQLKAAILASFQEIGRDLEEGTHHHYARHVATLAQVRTRGGLTARGVRFVYGGIARVLREMCLQLAEPGLQLEALEQVGLIMESAWAAVLENFVDGMRAALEDAHLAVLRELCSPIIPIHAGVLVFPLIGAIDAARGELLAATLLAAITRERAAGALLDITGVPAIEAGVADWLARLTRSARLLGAELLMVGVSPAIAATMADARLDLRGLRTFGTLQAGFEHVLARRGLKICPA